MKKVIVTGATGMIGVALTKYLLDRDINVLAIVRQNSKRANNLPHNKNLKIVECNLDHLNQLCMETNDYDTFFHLAWEGTIGETRNDNMIQSLNIQYTLDAVELARKSGCNTFIGAGSQAEFGRVEGIITEDSIENPDNAYGQAKLKAR